MIRTTHEPSLSGAENLAVIPYLRPREADAITDAIADGQLVAIMRDNHGIASGEIVGVVTPDMADHIIARNDTRLADLLDELASLGQELDTLRQITREVMAEKVPADFDYRIEGCIDDAEKILRAANHDAEEMTK